ncbi:MAG: cytidylate kinase-like family protein [Oscillospiraceae bacterium]|nr:cytidylate kinase-like family protein [Oscillospiraceae bacterium]
MKLNEPFVITISREVGSGGGSVARKLAEKLNVNYVNKELMQALQEKFNLTPGAIEHLKSTKKNWFTDLFEQVAPSPKATVKVGGYTYSRDVPEAVNIQDIYEAEVEILNAIADEGSCVIAGRSAFFVLKDRPNKVDVFITASKEARIKRIMEKQGLSREDAIDLIKTIDEGRENYVKRYTNLSRYDMRNYDLLLDMDYLTEDEAVAKILDFIGRSA